MQTKAVDAPFLQHKNDEDSDDHDDDELVYFGASNTQL